MSSIEHSTGYFLQLGDEGHQQWKLYRIIAGRWGRCELVEEGTLQHISQHLFAVAEKVSPLEKRLEKRKR